MEKEIRNENIYIYIYLIMKKNYYYNKNII